MLSVGPYSYNRFEAYEKSLQEGSKPDFLDVDKDGDEKESFKKALKDKKGKKDVKEGNCYQEGGKVEDKKEKKSPCEKCKEEGKKDCKCDDDKDDKKPAFLQKEAIIKSLMDDGLANNPVSAEVIAEHMSEGWKESILSNLN